MKKITKNRQLIYTAFLNKLGYLKDSNAAAHSVDTGISYRKNSWERCLENDQVVINSGFPTVNCRK